MNSMMNVTSIPWCLPSGLHCFPPRTLAMYGWWVVGCTHAFWRLRNASVSFGRPDGWFAILKETGGE